MSQLKQSFVENISLERCNCNIFRLTDTVADLGCSSGQVLSKTKLVTLHFFYISDITNSSSFNGKICRKKSMLEIFRTNVLNVERTEKRKEKEEKGTPREYFILLHSKYKGT